MKDKTKSARLTWAYIRTFNTRLTVTLAQPKGSYSLCAEEMPTPRVTKGRSS